MKNINIEINNSILKIIGIFEEQRDFDQIFNENGYKLKKTDESLKSFLIDNYYRDFRNLMFLKHEKVKNRVYTKNINQEVIFKTKSGEINVDVADSEIYLFGKEYIAIFCLTFDLKNINNIETFSSILNLVRNFESKLNTNLKWYEWIQNEVLCGIKIRGKGVNVNEYSGSKFKTYSVLDLNKEMINSDRQNLLFEIGTSSPIGSSFDSSHWLYPHPEYYEGIMGNKVSVFNNWESLALFDSFSTVGNAILDVDYKVNTWDETYLRIYLFRLFFKFNLFKFNKELSHTEKSLKTRFRYEEFLNIFNINHISYNFLPNEIFTKIGQALDIDNELAAFHERVIRISDNIKEKKQTNMNLLLEFISVISAIGVVDLIFGIVEILNKSKGLTSIVIYLFMLSIIVFTVNIIVRFVKTNLK